MLASASSSLTFWRVTTTLILNGPKPAAARLSMAWRAAAKEPSPRTASFIACPVAPSMDDLHVEIVEGRQLAETRSVFETSAVGGELDSDLPVDRVADEVHEIRSKHRLAPADVHVEDLEVDHLVDDVARPSAGVSSPGSRRPDELRQWTQARLQA